MKKTQPVHTIPTWAVAIVALMLGAISQANADILQFTGSGPAVPGLSPLNENPAHPESSATGSGLVTWDTDTNKMTVVAVFNGLTTPNTAAHIHCCVAAPGNAGVATTVPTFTGFPSGTTSGTYLHTFDMLALSSYNPSFVTSHGGTAATAAAALLAGLMASQSYLNIHTTMFGGGEMRGFMQPVATAPACPHGLGFWKNNESSWPVSSLTIGCQTYSQEELLDILRSPVRGDASLILAHQLIPAILNVFNGSNPVPVTDALSDADTLLCTFTGRLPYGVRPSTDDGHQMITLAGMLASSNDGGGKSKCTP